MSIRIALVVLVCWACPSGAAGRTAAEIIALAQHQLAAPSEIAVGEMRVYLGERLHRHYRFVLGKRWEPESRTEWVRIDFETPITLPDADSALRAHNRYLLKRTGPTPPAQWLYLPALRRVRLSPYRPEEPLLQSHYWFYDLTTIRNFDDYQYTLLDADEQRPLIEGIPRVGFVPYQRMHCRLERSGETYLVNTMTYQSPGGERTAVFRGYEEIAPRRFRPHTLLVTEKTGRTEITFQQWLLDAVGPEVFSAVALETKTMTLPSSGDEQ